MKLCDTLQGFLNGIKLMNNKTQHSAEWLESAIGRNEYQKPRLLETVLDDLRAGKLDTS